MNLADLRSFIDAQGRVEALYRDQEKWSEKAILNIARTGKFSSDRTIAEYAHDIWNVKPVEVVPATARRRCLRSAPHAAGERASKGCTGCSAVGSASQDAASIVARRAAPVASRPCEAVQSSTHLRSGLWLRLHNHTAGRRLDRVGPGTVPGLFRMP